MKNAAHPALLFTDLKNAFVNVRRSYFLDRLRKVGLPGSYIDVIAQWMSPRKVNLRTGSNSVGHSFVTDVGMPQGSPLSTIAYLLFNAEAMHLAESAGLVAVGCVDDMCFIADGSTQQGSTEKLQRLIPDLINWAKRSGAIFSQEKTQLLLPRSSRRTSQAVAALRWPDGTPIPPTTTVKYLGVLLCENRTDWSAHIAHCKSKAEKALCAIRSTCRRFKCLSTGARRRLLLTLVCSHLDWAHELTSQTQGHLTNLNTYERTLLRDVLGASQRVNADVLAREGDWPWADERRRHARAMKGAKLLCAGSDHPLLHLIQRTEPNVRFTGKTTALQRLLGEAATSSTLQDIARIERGGRAHVLMDAVESILLQPRAPWEPTPHTLAIAGCKDDAVNAHNALLQANCLAVYCDGATNSEASLVAGAAYAPELIRAEDGSYLAGQRAAHLGPRPHHTSYEAELIGVICACELLLENRTHVGDRRVVLLVDNQAVLNVLDNWQYSTSQRFVTEARRLLQRCVTELGVAVHLQWVPGHYDVPGNEKADRIAKEAAAGEEGAPFALFAAKLPRSILRSTVNKPAIVPADPDAPAYRRRILLEQLARSDVSADPRSTPASFSYAQLEGLPRALALVLQQFRMGEPRLGASYFQWRVAPTPECRYCDFPETALHFLFRCPHYEGARGKEMLSAGDNPIRSLARLLFLPSY